MSDSEDDYMSDKLLTICQDDVRPGLLFNRTVKRQHDLHKKKQELQAKKPKTQHQIEEERREKGLNTAISSDNKGFKLLQKMGFKPGEGLGKAKDGLKEPIKIAVKQGTSGVGRESHFKDIVTKKLHNKEKTLKAKVNEFKVATKEKVFNKFVRKDFYNAQKVCEELDFRHGVPDPIEEFYWTKTTIKTRRNVSEEDEDEFEQEFDSFIIVDNLNSSDKDDLNSSCPGPYRIDHDDV